MKIAKNILLAFFFTLSSLLVAQDNKTIYIKAEKFTQPLVEKWILEFNKKDPSTQIRIADSKHEGDITLTVKPEELSQNQKSISVGRYAILPISNNNNPALEDFSKNKLNKKIIKELFFENDLNEKENKKIIKLKDQVTIYSGNKSTSGSVLFASHFGYATNDLRDKRISGDDVYLLDAINKDIKGISINNLSYIYDLKTRNIKTNIAIIPLDLKKNQSEILESANLDNIIKLLETESVDLIPVSQIDFVYKNITPEVYEFVQWVLEEGQSYNNSYGFLTLDKKTYLVQQENIRNIYHASYDLK